MQAKKLKSLPRKSGIRFKGMTTRINKCIIGKRKKIKKKKVQVGGTVREKKEHTRKGNNIPL